MEQRYMYVADNDYEELALLILHMAALKPTFQVIVLFRGHSTTPPRISENTTYTRRSPFTPRKISIDV